MGLTPHPADSIIFKELRYPHIAKNKSNAHSGTETDSLGEQMQEETTQNLQLDRKGLI
jgi:hypothetical protein